MAKKKKNREKDRQKPARGKYTTAHDMLFSKEIAPRIRLKEQALAKRQYPEAERLRAEIEDLRRKWRLLKDERLQVKR